MDVAYASMARTLTNEQRDTLWEQFVEAYEKSQHSYDLNVRALAAGGIDVNASLGKALGTSARSAYLRR